MRTTATFAAARGPSHSLCSQRRCCVPGRPSVSLAWEWHCSPTLRPCSVSLSPLSLPVVSGPSAMGGGSCLCQAAGLDSALKLFAWRRWLLVMRADWPEEKRFGRSACPGAGFARGEGRQDRLPLWGPLQFVAMTPPLWLLVAPSVSRTQTPQRHGAGSTELPACSLRRSTSLGAPSCPRPCLSGAVGSALDMRVRAGHGVPEGTARLPLNAAGSVELC